MEKFTEVRNDYVFKDPENGIKKGIAIDVWKTDKYDEIGKTAAMVILNRHNDIIVVWVLEQARGNKDCLKAIEEAKNILKEEI